jgi:DNA (cytosine-5)-methyltransferase 1
MGENLETVKERLKTKKSKGKLEEKIAMDMFPTPTARDWKDTGQNTNYKRMAEKSILSGVVMMKQKKVGGRLNPEFVEFLMGYPLGWTEIETKD